MVVDPRIASSTIDIRVRLLREAERLRLQTHHVPWQLVTREWEDDHLGVRPVFLHSLCKSVVE